MKQDTFDIPAYKFAIKRTTTGKYIQFDNFDGLTLDEIYRIIYEKVSSVYDIDVYKYPINFVCYIGGEDCPNVMEIFSLIFYIYVETLVM